MKSSYKKNMLKDYYRRKKEMTLVEILASILILSLVVHNFFVFFYQSCLKQINQDYTA